MDALLVHALGIAYQLLEQRAVGHGASARESEINIYKYASISSLLHLLGGGSVLEVIDKRLEQLVFVVHIVGSILRTHGWH